MDQIDEPALSRRARRAVPLIAAALAVIVVASLIYLKATAPPPATTFSPVPYVSYLSLRYQVTYDFVSPSRGWALVVDQGFVPTFWVFGTTDGAIHWQRQLEGTPESGVSSIHFLDSRHGFAYAGVLYRTTDGGAYWEAISLPEGTPNFTFASPTQGWAVAIESDQNATTHLYSTADGGLTWHQLAWTLASPISPTAKGGFPSLGFRANGEGWLGAFRQDPTVYLTKDSGRSWRAITIPLPPEEPADMHPTEVTLLPSNGVIVHVAGGSNPGRAFTSFDAGDSWRSIPSPPSPMEFGDLSFVDGRHWWASRWGILWKTSDAGQNWTTVREALPDVPGEWIFQAAHVIDAQHAWLQMFTASRVNGGSGLEMSSDGGVHWSSVNVPRLG